MAGPDAAVKVLLTIMLMGGSYWLGVEARARHPAPEIYRPAPPAPVNAVLQVPTGECREIQRLRKRMEKIRGQG